MPPSVCTYSEAVHYAADTLLACDSLSAKSRAEKLTDLLYSLAQSIPSTWATKTRFALIAREPNMDRLLKCVAEDICIDDLESRRYLVLSSICQLVLTIKQQLSGTSYVTILRKQQKSVLQA